MKTTLLLFSSTFISLCVLAQPTWQWGHEAGGPGNDLGYSISTDPGGNSYVTGRFHATASFGPNSVSSYGGPDIFVAKYNTSGTCLWARHGGSIDGQDPYGDEGDGIDIDAAGNCYVTGNFKGQATFGSTVIGTSSSAARNIFLAKYDANGNVLWAMCPVSSGSNNYSRSVAVDAAGNAYITGYLGGGTNTFGSFTLTGAGGFVVKYDANGTVVYATKFGVNGAIDLYGIDIDAAGSAYTTGYLQTWETINSVTYSSTGIRDAVLIKVNASGNFQWLKRSTGIANSSTCMPHGICSDGEDGIYFCGSFADMAIFGTDTLQAGLWAAEICVVKYDTAGNLAWTAQSLSQNVSSTYDALAITSNGNSKIFITGHFYTDLIFGGDTLFNNGFGDNTFILSLNDSTGAGGFTIASTGQNPGARGQGISTDNAGSVYICGVDKAPVIFGQDTTAFIGAEDFFIAKLGSEKPMDVSELNSTSALVFNSGENLHVVVDAAMLSEHSDFILYDMMGRELKKVSITAEETIISVSDLPVGIYCWRVEGKTESTGKIFIDE